MWSFTFAILQHVFGETTAMWGHYTCTVSCASLCTHNSPNTCEHRESDTIEFNAGVFPMPTSFRNATKFDTVMGKTVEENYWYAIDTNILFWDEIDMNVPKSIVSPVGHDALQIYSASYTAKRIHWLHVYYWFTTTVEKKSVWRNTIDFFSLWFISSS